MHYVVLDFETTGFNRGDDGNPFPSDREPLPRESYPVQLSAELVDAQGQPMGEVVTIMILGAERLAPWVLEHCPHLSIKGVERDGIPFSEALQKLADLVGDRECTLVAHNMAFDWDQVLKRTAHEQNLESSPAFVKLASLPRFCTCVNETHKYWNRRYKTWAGKRLQALASYYGVPFDEGSAHDATYDVRVTRECLKHMLERGHVA